MHEKDKLGILGMPLGYDRRVVLSKDEAVFLHPALSAHFISTLSENNCIELKWMLVGARRLKMDVQYLGSCAG